MIHKPGAGYFPDQESLADSSEESESDHEKQEYDSTHKKRVKDHW